MFKKIKKLCRKRSRKAMTKAPTASRLDWFRKKTRALNKKLFQFDKPRFVNTREVNAVRRKDLRVRDYLNPIYWIQWLASFSVGWLMSRRYVKLAGALPAILLGIVSVSLFGFAAISRPQAQNSSMRVVFSEAIEDGNFRRASIAIGALLEQSPTNADLMYHQAMVNLKLGKQNEARKQIEQLVAEKKHPLAALWIISKDFDMKNVSQWDASEHSRFRGLIEVALTHATDENLVSTQILMANYFVASQNPGEALRFYDSIVESTPTQALAALSIAKQQFDSERSKRFAKISTAVFQKRLSNSPSDSASRLALAQTWLLTGKPKEAAQLLNDGMKLSDDPKIPGLLGVALLAWADTMAPTEDNALKRLQILQSAMTISPQNQAVAQSMIRVLIQCRDHEDPNVRKLRDRILASSSGATADFVKGTVALLENQFEDALSHLRIASAKQPNMPAIMNNLAVAIGRTPGGNLEHALMLVTESLRSEPTHPYFLETRGNLLVKMARYQEAIPDLEKALEAPELKPLIFPALALAYKQVGKVRLAEEFEMLSKNPL